MVEKEPLKKMHKFADQRNFYEADDTLKQLLVEWKELFKKRFSFRNEIEPIEPDTLKKNFAALSLTKR